jgi:predicted phosphodiesterase
MAFALVSDIHANLPALEAVLDDVARRDDIDATYHLGDLVGYNAWPNEVIARLRAEALPGVAGNYDSTVAAGSAHCGCRASSPREEELAHASYGWTRRAVSRASRAYLGGLPFRIDLRPLGGHVAGPTVVLVHATPVNNLVYVTQDRTDDFLRKLAAQAQLRAGDVLCFGHTHRPWHRELEGIHFVNTGSVGRPKDGDWRAGYVLLAIDRDRRVEVEFVRVEYDLERAVRALHERGLPAEFETVLRSGGALAASGPSE